MTAIVLMAASAAIFFVIGALHLSGTFLGSGLTSRDLALRKSMGEISSVVTEETTMWRCWVGFNAGLRRSWEGVIGEKWEARSPTTTEGAAGVGTAV